MNRKSAWDVHFENVSSITTTHTAKVISQPRLASVTSIEDYSVSTTTPGDSISFTFDVVNDGNYDAKITSVNIGTPSCSGLDTVSNSNVCSHISYTLTYDNGSSVQANDILYAQDKEKMKVTLTYDSTVTASELATEDVSISNLGITINFSQYGDALIKDNGEVAEGFDKYYVGDPITLHNELYYVAKKSSGAEDYVVLMKDEPLTEAEINTYGSSIPITAGVNGDYGTMQYGANNNYDTSYIKIVVDAWSDDKFSQGELKEVNGYKARLITKDELYNNLDCGSGYCGDSKYSWMKTIGSYFTMTPYGNANNLYYVHNLQWRLMIHAYGTPDGLSRVRPIINVYKSAIQQS